jgi:hypothetical protein
LVEGTNWSEGTISRDQFTNFIRLRNIWCLGTILG